MTAKQYAALLGFAFVAAWIGFGFGDAILCLIGAGVLYVAAGVKDGEIDLADLQARLGIQANRSTPPPPAPASRVPRPSGRARVQ